VVQAAGAFGDERIGGRPEPQATVLNDVPARRIVTGKLNCQSRSVPTWWTYQAEEMSPTVSSGRPWRQQVASVVEEPIAGDEIEFSTLQDL